MQPLVTWLGEYFDKKLSCTLITNNNNAHEWVQAQFAGELIHRRKILLMSLQRGLQDIQRLRNIADYDSQSVSKGSIERHIRKTHEFCSTIFQRL